MATTPDALPSLRDRYVRLFGVQPAADGALEAIEGALEIALPKDLKEISGFYAGGFLGGISHNAIDWHGPASNVVDETRRLRFAIDLPRRFLVLAEPPSSLIVLDCDAAAIRAPAVIWCDDHDVGRLRHLDLGAMSVPKTWVTYTGFFSHLLDEEEQERREPWYQG